VSDKAPAVALTQLQTAVTQAASIDEGWRVKAGEWKVDDNSVLKNLQAARVAALTRAFRGASKGSGPRHH